jgi:cytochrome c556
MTSPTFLFQMARLGMKQQGKRNMDRRLVSAVGFLSLAALGTALAQTTAPPITYSPEQIIAARQAGYDNSVSSFALMRTAAKDGTDVKREVYPAESLARWAKVLPTLFPKGTGLDAYPTLTHAKPEIWSDRAGFDKAAATYLAAATKAADLAHAGDTDGFKAQLEEIKKTCDACHQNYKAKGD